MLSEEICNELLTEFKSVESSIAYLSGSPKFPLRKQYRNISDKLIEKI